MSSVKNLNTLFQYVTLQKGGPTSKLVKEFGMLYMHLVLIFVLIFVSAGVTECKLEENASTCATAQVTVPCFCGITIFVANKNVVEPRLTHRS